jgi:peptidoglycan/LPS O-acetylase OafA/YrhL
MWLTGSPKLPALLDALPGFLTFMQTPNKVIDIETGVFWTLHVEFWFYLSMPLLIMLMGHGRRLLIVVFALIALSYALKFAPALFDASVPNFSPLSFLRWADNLLYGTIVAILMHHRRLKIPMVLRTPLLLGSFAAIIAIARFIPNTDRLITWPLEASVASLLTALLLAAYLATPIEIHIAPWAWLGRISYSIYLVHAIPLEYANRLAGSTRWSTEILLSLVLVMATSLHYLIEKPGIRLGRRLTVQNALSPSLSLEAAAESAAVATARETR